MNHYRIPPIRWHDGRAANHRKLHPPPGDRVYNDGGYARDRLLADDVKPLAYELLV